MPGNAYVLPTCADVKKMPFFTNLRLFFRILTPKKPPICGTICGTFTTLYHQPFLVFICHEVVLENAYAYASTTLKKSARASSKPIWV